MIKLTYVNIFDFMFVILYVVYISSFNWGINYEPFDPFYFNNWNLSRNYVWRDFLKVRGSLPTSYY